MTGPEHFLSRWSRKKQEEKKQDEKLQGPADETRAAAAPRRSSRT